MTSHATPVTRPPTYLSAASKRLWARTLADYEFSTAPDLELLAQLCATTDRLAEVRAAIRKQGVAVPGSAGQPVPNRLISTENELKRTLVTLTRALRLNMEGSE